MLNDVPKTYTSIAIYGTVINYEVDRQCILLLEFLHHYKKIK